MKLIYGVKFYVKARKTNQIILSGWGNEVTSSELLNMYG
jgi:hypothetical protein